MRHALGHYRAVIVTGRYVQQLKGDSSEVTGIDTFIPALKHCIATHPVLSAAIRGEGTEAPQFVRPAKLDLRNHIEICVPPTYKAVAATDEADILEEITVKTHDQLFPDVDHIPPWKIVVVPLSPQPGSSERRIYIIFSFSHSHCDGKSGLAFHKAFLTGLETGHLTYDNNPLHLVPSRSLLPSLEEACDLKITLPFLLGPLIGTYLPKFVSEMLNLQTSVTPQTPESWTALPVSFDPENLHTGMEIIVIDKDTLNGTLAACKSHGVKFTGLLHQVIVRALSQALPADAPAENFVSATALDLRHLVSGFSSNDMALCVSGTYEAFPRVDSASGPGREQSEDDKEAMWVAARNSTARLAADASTLVNQPVGLLRYLAHFRMWLVNQIGKPHDTSYEVSNILSFDPFDGDNKSNAATASNQNTRTWDIDRLAFSQPGNPTGSPLAFQVVSRKGGTMIITVTWQIGILGVPDEGNFVKGIANSIKAHISNIASAAA